MNSDINIAMNNPIKDIIEIGKVLGLNSDDLECYGKYKAKVSFDTINRVKDRKDGKLILVSAINPTPSGEGKTTTMIGLHQALYELNYNSIVTMREPSLGPCFGRKGGATGGGYAQVIPMDDINLHFTGDIHAITSANNLICAIIDNEIYQGNSLNIDPNRIIIRRVLDLNDRGLRDISYNIKDNTINSGFDISVACEIMAILCLANDLKDFKDRLNSMVVAYTYDNKAINIEQLEILDALLILLKDAIKPNLVQTLNHAPVLVHGGPFANIAHGCNSMIATKLGMKLCDYTITEAGFGADLGAEKFFNIKCRSGNLKPDCVVLVVTNRALKMHGGLRLDELDDINIDALSIGINNLYKHIENMNKFNIDVVVAINIRSDDSKEEIDYILDCCHKLNIRVELSEVFMLGAKGAYKLAELVIDTINNKSKEFKCLYDDNVSIIDKINIICKEIYGANSVEFNDKALMKIKLLTEKGYDKFPICMAKTPISLSDDPKLLGRPSNFNIKINDIVECVGARFIVAISGNILRMPGLPKDCNAKKMSIDENGIIDGLS